MLFLMLLGCPAADLGVELPPEGLEAISAEDLRRDTELFVREGTSAWSARMAAMNAVPSLGPRLCVGQGAGAESAPARWAAPDVSTGKFTLGDAVDAAALVSLAKAWDTLGNKPGPRLYCLGDGPGQRLPSMSASAAAVQDVDFREVAKILKKVAL